MHGTRTMEAVMKVGLKSLVVLAALAVVGSATGALAAGGTAGDYPSHTSKDGLTVDYSLVENPSSNPASVQATGIIETGGQPVDEVTLEFVALDSAGNIVERNQEIVHWGFDESAPQSFSVALASDPRAENYELRIGDYVLLDQMTHGR
jgi:hypothetical protein